MPSRPANQPRRTILLPLCQHRTSDRRILSPSFFHHRKEWRRRERKTAAWLQQQQRRKIALVCFFSRHHRSVRHLFLYNLQLLLHSTEVTTKGVRANPKERRKQNNLTIMEQAYMGTGSTMEKVCSVVVSFLSHVREVDKLG